MVLDDKSLKSATRLSIELNSNLKVIYTCDKSMLEAVIKDKSKLAINKYISREIQQYRK